MEESQSAAHPATPQSAEVANISLSLRIPPFWRDRPRLWFFSFEAATHDLKRSQAQLAQMVIAQLERQDIEQITDLLYNPPAADQYTAIKEPVSESLSSKATLEELALLADKMLEQSTHIAAVSLPQAQPPQFIPQNDTQMLIAEIRKLSLEIDELKSKNYDSYRRKRFQSRSRRYSQSRSRQSSPSPASPHCYYHRRFGAQARKCTAPCNFKTSEN
ncbi:hypothetical protein ACJJTC_000868 [Scirpophaga incertulas]